MLINLMLSTFKRKEKRRKEKGTLLRSSLFWDVTQGRLAVGCTHFKTNSQSVQ